MGQKENGESRNIVVVTENKRKIDNLKRKYKNLGSEDNVPEELRKLEIKNNILRAAAIIVGVSTAVNLIVPDAMPFADEALMGILTAIISGASHITSNKIDDLAKYGTTEVKVEEVKNIAAEIANAVSASKQRRALEEINKSDELAQFDQEFTFKK